MNNAITITRDGKNYGPYSKEELHELIASRNVSPDDLAWKEGMSDWRPLRVVMEGLSHLPKSPQPPPAPADPIQPATKRGVSPMVMATILISVGIVILLFHQAVSDANPGPPTGTDHYYTAIATIREHLKAPSTAKFSSVSEDKAYCEEVAGTVWEAGGWVDSQNGFGAMLRSRWVLVWDIASRKILFLKVDGKPLIGDYHQVILDAKNATTEKK